MVTAPERRQRVQTRMRRGAPSIIALTRWRFGRCTFLVLMFEWLTLLPTRWPLAQISHVIAMGSDSEEADLLAAPGRRCKGFSRGSA